MRPITTIVALAAMLTMAGCMGARPATAVQVQAKGVQARQTEIKQITVAQVGPHLKAHPKATLLDVRMPDEYTEGHAPGALLRPLPELSQWAAGLDKSAPYVVICRSGSRSMKAATQLVALGFTDITNVQGGMLAWEQDPKLPVVRGPEPGVWPAARPAK
jgi:rhodanese-related sulfurtransferase